LRCAACLEECEEETSGTYVHPYVQNERVLYSPCVSGYCLFEIGGYLYEPCIMVETQELIKRNNLQHAKTYFETRYPGQFYVFAYEALIQNTGFINDAVKTILKRLNK
jgi:hypothetical protein